MIGYQILACEQTDGSFLCAKVSAYYSIEVNMLKKNLSKELYSGTAREIYDMKDDTDFPLSLEELKEISEATNCISESEPGYHPLACDGIVVIPVTMDKFIGFREFIKN